MTIFLYGPDTYRSRQKLVEIKEKFIQEVDKSALNITKLNGEKLTLNKFRETVLVPGFLARRRLIIIENICQNKNVQLQTAVMKFLERRDSKRENIVVFWEEDTKYERNTKVRKNNKLFGKLKQQKYAQEFALLKGYKLNEWVKKEINKQGRKIENQAIDLLTSSVGSDLWQMKNEIDKLISYKQNKIITSDDINLLVKSKIDENIFNLVDALGTKNKKLALKLLNDQLENKTPWTYLIAMIIRQFRILLQVKSSVPNLSFHPFVLRKAQAQAQNYSLEELKNIYQRLLKIDVQLKTSQIDPRVLFDLFIVKQ
jgi:DNA polymerase-3 subunit delta